MPTEWLTYARAGELLGMKAEGVRQKAIRQRWPRRPGNDGRTEVAIDVAEVVASAQPRRPSAVRKPPVEAAVPQSEPTPVSHPEDTRITAVLEARIADLKDMLTKAEGRADAEQLRADRITSRLEQDVAELRSLVDSLKQPRSWWRKLG